MLFSLFSLKKSHFESGPLDNPLRCPTADPRKSKQNNEKAKTLISSKCCKCGFFFQILCIVYVIMPFHDKKEEEKVSL